MTVTEAPIENRQVAGRPAEEAAPGATCYSVTIFTNRWREMRDFYVDILGAEVVSERTDRYTEMRIGGVPLCLRRSECGEMVSYFHLYLSLKNREPVLNGGSTPPFLDCLGVDPVTLRELQEALFDYVGSPDAPPPSCGRSRVAVLP
jgi:catechol 2,3-dioxygenase-like lactoylglutathione lyase family enzyme